MLLFKFLLLCTFIYWVGKVCTDVITAAVNKTLDVLTGRPKA